MFCYRSPSKLIHKSNTYFLPPASVPVFPTDFWFLHDLPIMQWQADVEGAMRISWECLSYKTTPSHETPFPPCLPRTLLLIPSDLQLGLHLVNPPLSQHIPNLVRRVFDTWEVLTDCLMNESMKWKDFHSSWNKPGIIWSPTQLKV